MLLIVIIPQMSSDDDQHRSDERPTDHSDDDHVPLHEGQTESSSDDDRDMGSSHPPRQESGQGRSADQVTGPERPVPSTSSSSTGKRKRYSIRTTQAALRHVQYNTLCFKFVFYFN
jgi:hypothetical protein